MKELSIEEKAKAYDEAIKMAKSKIKNDKDHVLYENDVIEIFPELKESEGERIRQFLIHEVTETSDEIMSYRNMNKKDVLAWLEKQKHEEWSLYDEKILSEIFTSVEIAAYSEEKKKEIISWLQKYRPYMHEKQGEQEQDINIQINPSEYINDMGGNGCYLKNVTQVFAWSEEDEEMFDAVIANIQFTQKTHNHEVNQIVYEREIDWLKSLKDRVQPQTKQELSEENKCMLNNVIDTLKPLSQTTHSGYAINSMIDWLKSLRPQNTWKPSDEQMKALSAINVTGGISYAGQGQELINLYNDLKTLKLW